MKQGVSPLSGKGRARPIGCILSWKGLSIPTKV